MKLVSREFNILAKNLTIIDKLQLGVTVVIMKSSGDATKKAEDTENNSSNKEPTSKTAKTTSKLSPTKVPSDKIRKCLFGPADERDKKIDLNSLLEPAQNRSRSFPQLCPSNDNNLFFSNKEERYIVVEKIHNVSYPKRYHGGSPGVQNSKRFLNMSPDETEYKKSRTNCSTPVTDTSMVVSDVTRTIWKSPSKYGMDIKFIPKQSSLDRLVNELDSGRIYKNQEEDIADEERTSTKMIRSISIGKSLDFIEGPDNVNDNISPKQHVKVPIIRLRTHSESSAGQSDGFLKSQVKSDHIATTDENNNDDYEFNKEESKNQMREGADVKDPKLKIVEKIKSLDFVPISRIHLSHGKDSNEEEIS